ncbi:hypothetical protein CSPX01_00760 [Colletotrichum filicis]|nr:hypothetical protein CSPX01_00760 [Colletotrichum filicis]
MKISLLLIAVCSASFWTRGLTNVRYHRSVLFLKIPLACRRAKVKFVEKPCVCDKKSDIQGSVSPHTSLKKRFCKRSRQGSGRDSSENCEQVEISS